MAVENGAAKTERRRHRRVAAYNTVDYLLFDGNRKKIGRGKGTTKNLSQSGTLVETDTVLEGAFIVLMTLDLDGELVKVKGRIISSRWEPSAGKFLTGIEFIGSRDEQYQAIVTFVRSYHYRKRQADQAE